MNFKTLNELTTSLFVEELARQGVTEAFIAPGSRSTPLVLACENNPKITVHTHFDERGLGFFALGCAKKTQKPTLIITTSGTAVANLLPAVVEAYYSQTPLIICSADRPSELINVGANQAITQKDIFQNFTCDSFQIPPVNEKTPLESILTLASHSVFRTLSQKSPVHVNWMFQEPLAPLTNDLGSYKILEKIKKWYSSDRAYTEIVFSKTIASEIDLSFLKDSKKILVLFGSLLDQKDTLKIAAKLNAPVFCDVQNPMRFTNFPQNILRYDLLMNVVDIETPDVILHIGGPLTSKTLNKFIENFDGEYVQVQNSAKRLDFMHKSKKLLHASPQEFYSQISETQWNFDPAYLTQFKIKSEKLEQALQSELKDLNEMSLPYHLVANSKNTNFFVGSSMPIRDLERFAGTGDSQFIFNRGASGIDGNIATAAGSALLSENKTVCVLGDQAFLYDVNSLALAKNAPQPFHTIVINNQGGGIFSFLPVAQIDRKTFTKNFTHPHEWNLKAAADMFFLKYTLAKTPEDLFRALDSNESTLIEIKSDIDQNVKAHRDLTQKLIEMLPHD
ncbi:MAG: 2-succinyl-5-enolpyruvyl-6-hydroxy-3-cyclohexene-1-carboxylic-acid synthase [Bdellovibrionota bacterium]